MQPRFHSTHAKIAATDRTLYRCKMFIFTAVILHFTSLSVFASSLIMSQSSTESSSSPLPVSPCASLEALIAISTVSVSPILFVDLMPSSMATRTPQVAQVLGVAALTAFREAIAPIIVCTVKDALDILRRQAPLAATLVRAESTALVANRNVSAILHSANIRHLPTALITYGDERHTPQDDADVCIHRCSGGTGIDWSIVTAIFNARQTHTPIHIAQYSAQIVIPQEQSAFTDSHGYFCQTTRTALVAQRTSDNTARTQVLLLITNTAACGFTETVPASSIGDSIIRSNNPRPLLYPSHPHSVVTHCRVQWTSECTKMLMSRCRTVKIAYATTECDNDCWVALLTIMREWNESLRVEFAGAEFLLSPSQTALDDAVMSCPRTIDDIIEPQRTGRQPQQKLVVHHVQLLRCLVCTVYNPMEYSTVTNAEVIVNVCWNYTKNMISTSTSLSTLSTCCAECGRTPVCIQDFCSAECLQLSHNKLALIGTPRQMTDFELFNTAQIRNDKDDRFNVIEEEIKRWGNHVYVDYTNSVDTDGVGLRARTFIAAESILLPLHGVIVMSNTMTPPYRSRLLADETARNRCLDADILNEGEYEFGIVLNEYCAGVCINSTFGMKNVKRNVRFALHPQMILPKYNVMWKTIPSGLYMVIADRDIQADEELLNDYKFTDKKLRK